MIQGNIIISIPNTGKKSKKAIKKEKFNLSGQLLHARTIGFVHPSTGEMMQFSSELPDYFTDVIEKLRAEKERNFK